MSPRTLLPLLLALAWLGCGRTQAPRPFDPTPAERVRAALPAFLASAGPERSADPRMSEIRALLRDQRTDEAVALLTALAPEDATHEAEFLLGWVQNQAERHSMALPHLARAIDGGPTFPKARQVFYLYGRSLQETGDLAGARAAYEADAELFPAQANGLDRLALLDLEAGDLATGEARARQCLGRFDQARDVAKAHALLADVHLARDEPAEARAELERCVETFPHYEAFYKLSRLCERMGDAEAAARYLEAHREWRTRAGR